MQQLPMLLIQHGGGGIGRRLSVRLLLHKSDLFWVLSRVASARLLYTASRVPNRRYSALTDSTGPQQAWILFLESTILSYAPSLSKSACQVEGERWRSNQVPAQRTLYSQCKRRGVELVCLQGSVFENAPRSVELCT